MPPGINIHEFNLLNTYGLTGASLRNIYNISVELRDLRGTHPDYFTVIETVFWASTSIVRRIQVCRLGLVWRVVSLMDGAGSWGVLISNDSIKG